MTGRINADHNASTPALPSVVAAMVQLLRGQLANPSSVHRAGQAARATVETARRRIAARLGVDSGFVVLTSGATEANNLALIEPPRGAILASPMEHPSVTRVLDALARGGRDIEALPNDSLGRVDLEWLGARLRSGGVGMVCLGAANGELGVINPVEQAGDLCAKHGASFHVDAAQAFGRIPWSVPVGASSVTLSGHKFGGPQGVGALWLREPAGHGPLLAGGGQERGLRAGTENVVAIHGLGEAAHTAEPDAWASTAVLRDRFEAGVLSALDASVNGDPACRLPNTSNISFLGARAEEIVVALDLDGVACSAGAACSAGSVDVSPVIRALGIGAEREHSAVRFSLGPDADPETVDELVTRVVHVVRRCRRNSVRG